MAIHFSGKNGISIVTNLGQFIRVEGVQVYSVFFFFLFQDGFIVQQRLPCLEVHNPLAPSAYSAPPPQDRVFLYSPGCLETLFRYLPVSTSCVLGFKACTTCSSVHSVLDLLVMHILN